MEGKVVSEARTPSIVRSEKVDREVSRSRTPSSARSEASMVAVGSRASSPTRSDEDDLPLVDLVALSRTASTELPPRKRPHSPAECTGSDPGSGEEVVPAPKIASARRGRGRVATHGQYVGLAQAKREAEEARKAAERADEEARASAERIASLRSPREPPPKEKMAEACTAGELQARLQGALDEITSVSRVSKGLKGTCQKSLKAAVLKISEVAEVLMDRTTSEEVRRLRAENARLAAQVQDMVAAQEAMRADLAGLRESRAAPLAADAPPDPLLAQVLKELASLGSRFSFLEARVLRPPLGVRQTAPASQAAPSYAAKAAIPRAAPTAASTSPAAPVEQRKAKKRGKKAAAPEASVSAVPTSVARTGPSSQQAAGSWETVGAKRKAAKAKRKAAKKAAKARRRLRAPRSTAVVITIQPEAVERGVDYASVMKEARAKINLEALDINGGIKMKPTRTGARLIEIPGATSGPKADALANQLRASFKPEDISVSRPTKRAEVRISGLDDSVASEEVVAAVAKATGCSAEDIRCGVIRSGVRGLGAVVVSCPVAAAQKLSDGRRVLVGWVSAQVRLLQPRPERCYRCLAVGHVGVKCSAGVDCSEKCFRCSRPGHKAGTCDATPHCFVCAAAGKPAEHQLGSKACAGTNAKAKKVEGAKAQRQPAPNKKAGGGTQKSPAPLVVEEAEMDTQ